MVRYSCWAVLILVSACSDATPPLATADPGVVFTYPADAQIDVPTGTRVVVEFSDPIDQSKLASCAGQGANPTGAFCIVGPDGALDVTPAATPDGNGVTAQIPLDPGTTYQVFVGSALSPPAKNLPSSGALFSFTTRSDRPRAAAPELVAINGAPPAMPEAFRPMFESTTIRLVFSEPLDPRSVQLAPGFFQLVDKSADAQVPATLLTDGIHVSIDPRDDLTAGAQYEVQLGDQIVDLGGQALAPIAIPLVPKDTRNGNPVIPEVLRTREMTDPGAPTSRAGADANVIVMDKPLIGIETSQLESSVLASELGDPKALPDGSLAFTIRRGQRLHATGLDVKLGGQIPAGLSTGDIEIELLTDAGGRLYRNPHQPADQRPENERAPLYADLSMDVAVYAVDPTGNAVLAQTVLGLQASGIVIATEGVLDIQTVSSMDLGLLGVASAPTNLVLELITDPKATVDADTTAPQLVASMPNAGDLPVDDGVELIFSEPIDLDRARSGGIKLQTSAGADVASVIESHGSAVVVRPIAPLPYSQSFQVVLSDVADVAGNPLPATGPLTFSTPKLASTNVAITAVAVHPGVPCALTGGGRCAGGAGGDDLYHPFTLASDEPLSITFSAPVSAQSVTYAAVCNGGSVRVEEVDANGNCVAAVPGTLTHHDRTVTFIPDAPWATGTPYKLTVVAGNNNGCDTGELCGANGNAANFDPLDGDGGNQGGGGNLVIPFTAVAASGATYVFASAAPYTDTNGNGAIDGVETLQDDNRVALQITSTSGIISSATFNATDCVASIAGTQACIYLSGAMPVEMQPVSTNCPLPDGSTASSCIPVVLSPQVMYGTSIHLDATALITIGSDTQTTVIRVREPAGGPVTGYIVDENGTPTLELALDLYMDAPDMSIPLASHDLHSKPLSVTLSGPVRFLPDGRIAIAASNTADVGVSVTVDAGIIGSGKVNMNIPRGEMHLQLVSSPIRGGLR